MKKMAILISLIIVSCNDQTPQNSSTMDTFDSKTGYELKKIYPVSQEKVFKALTNPEVLRKIWGVQSISVDARVGGKTNAVYVDSTTDWSFTITYSEVVPNEKLKWVTHFKSFPNKETRVTLLFDQAEAGTEFTVRMENFESSEERDANKTAWKNALDTLDKILK